MKAVEKSTGLNLQLSETESKMLERLRGLMGMRSKSQTIRMAIYEALQRREGASRLKRRTMAG